MAKEEKTNVLELPTTITKPTLTAPRDLVILGIPKIGKGTILGDFTTTYNALVLDLECGGYEYIPARKISTYDNDGMTEWESFQNYIKYRNALIAQKGKYDYLIVDGLSDLDSLSVIGGTLVYMDSTIGKKFNRRNNGLGEKIPWGDPEWKPVTSLPDGNGYQHTRKWFIDQINLFKQIAPYRLYAAHLADKFIKDDGKEDVIGSEISLTGKLKTIFASKVTALCKIVADGDKRYLNFDVQNESIVAGSRSPLLKGKILISEKTEDGAVKTYWDKIYN